MCELWEPSLFKNIRWYSLRAVMSSDFTLSVVQDGWTVWTFFSKVRITDNTYPSAKSVWNAWATLCLPEKCHVRSYLKIWAAWILQQITTAKLTNYLTRLTAHNWQQFFTQLWWWLPLWLLKHQSSLWSIVYLSSILALMIRLLDPT